MTFGFSFGSGGGVSSAIPNVAIITKAGRPVSSAAVGTTYKVLIPTTGNPPTAVPAGNWTLDGVNISGATGVEYTPVATDAGRILGWSGTGMVGEALGPITVNIGGEKIITYSVNTAGAVVESVTFDGLGEAIAVLSGTLSGSYEFPEADLLAEKPQQIAPATWNSGSGAFTAPTFIYSDDDAATVTSTTYRNGASIGTDQASYTPLDNAPYSITYTATNTAAAVPSVLEFRPALSGVLYNGTSNKLTRSPTTAITTGSGAMLFGQITLAEWPNATRYACWMNDRFVVRQEATGQVRFESIIGGIQRLSIVGPLAAGTRINFVMQYDGSGVSKPQIIVQYNDGLPTVLRSNSYSGALADITDVVIGQYGTVAGTQWPGKIHRMELRSGVSIIGALADQAAVTAAMRKFCSADGFYVDPVERNSLYGTPSYIATAIPDDHTAGTNPGTGTAWVPTGTFSGGIPAQFQDIPLTTFDSAAGADSLISPIISATGSTPTHTIVSQPSTNYKIVGNDLKLNSSRAYTGTWDEVVIRTTDDSGSFDRTHNLFAGQAGQDTLLGRVTLVKSGDNVYAGEHVDLHLDGLTDRESALLNIVWDMGQPGATYTSHAAYFNTLRPANIRHGMQAPMVWDTAGTKTVTVNIYRAGSTTPALTLSTTVTVLDPASIPNADTFFVSNTGFAGAPSGSATYDNLPAAIVAALDRNTTNTKRILVRGSDVWATTAFPTKSTPSNGSKLIVEPFGAGSPNLGTLTSALYLFGDPTIISSVVFKNITARLGFDGVNIVDGNNIGTQGLRTTFLSSVGLLRGTLYRCDLRGGCAYQSEHKDSSLLAYDCITDEHNNYSYYLGRIGGGGMVGCSIQRQSPNKPNISKAAYANSRTDEALISVNGAWRATNPTRYTVAHCAFTNEHGWSIANPSQALAPLFPALSPGYAGNTNQYPTQQGSRMLSAEPIGKCKILIDGNETEGLLDFGDATGRVNGLLVFSRNHTITTAANAILLDVYMTGAWVVGNTFNMPDVPSEVSDSKRFTKLFPATFAVKTGFDDAKRQRNYFIGNTFRDQRSAANLHSGDTGQIDAMFENIKDTLNYSVGNVIHIPNRTTTAPTISGMTKVDAATQFSTNIHAVPFYSGFKAVPESKISPTFTWTPADIDTAYATPASAGHSLQPTGTATFLTSFAVGTFTPAYGMEGTAFSGASRPLGAWTTTT